MTPLQQLVNEVLLGTERRTPVLPVLPEPWMQALTAGERSDASLETKVLRMAGALSLGELAGQEPVQVPEGFVPLAASPSEGKPAISDPALVSCLSWIFHEAPERLQAQALQGIAAAGKALPHALLPRLLQLGDRSDGLRALIGPVQGARGLWLGALLKEAPSTWLPEAQVGDDDVWAHGTLEQRRIWLIALRRSDPSRARSLLSEGLAALAARERALLVGALETGLSASDEPLLQGLLGDRSKEVRQIALHLLARLPEGAFCRRMADRLSPLMRRERKLIRTVWMIDPPETFEAGWKLDGLEEKREGGETLGERAWWLAQLAGLLPLGWWTGHTGLSVAELLAWVQGSDWCESVLRAWGQAFRRQPDQAWAEALLGFPMLAQMRLEAREVLRTLSFDAQEKHWMTQLQESPGADSSALVLTRLIAALVPGQLVSENLARAMLAAVRTALQVGGAAQSHMLRFVLPELACVLPASFLDTPLLTTGDAGEHAESLASTLVQVQLVIQQRKILHRLLIPVAAP